MRQPSGLGYCGVALCHCPLGVTETEKGESQKRLRVNVEVVAGMMGQRVVENRIV